MLSQVLSLEQRFLAHCIKKKILDYFLAQSPYPKHEESEEQKVIDTNLSTHILLMIQLDPDFHTRLFPGS